MEIKKFKVLSTDNVDLLGGAIGLYNSYITMYCTITGKDLNELEIDEKTEAMFHMYYIKTPCLIKRVK